jgi:hypothetical protein
MSSIAQEARPDLVRPPLPSWGTAMTAAFLGWLIATCSLGAFLVLVEALGLLGRVEGTGIRDWPFPAAGWAGVAANTVVWLWILALTALFVRGMLADRVGRPVSALPIFAVLVITGFAPLVPRGLFDVPWPVAFLGTAALLRYVPELRVRVLSKRQTARLLAVGALFLAVPAAHALRHPLWPGTSVMPSSPGTTSLSLENTGFADVELEGVSLRSPGMVLRLEDVRVDRRPLFEHGGPESARLPFTIEPRSEAFVQLRHRGLGCGVMPATASVLYRVNGAARAMSLPLTVEGRKAC